MNEKLAVKSKDLSYRAKNCGRISSVTGKKLIV